MTPKPLTRISALRWWLDHTPHLRRARWLWTSLLVASGYVLLGWLEVIWWAE